MRWAYIWFLFFFCLLIFPLAGDSLMGWWPFDEGRGDIAFDASGNEHKASLSTGSNSGRWTSNGKNKGALVFNGTDDYADLGNSTFNIDNTTEFSIACWVKFTAQQKRNQVILSRGQYAYPFQLELTAGNDLTLKAALRTEKTFYLYSKTKLQLNTWYHVALSYADPDFRLLINGKPDNNLKAGGNPAMPTQDSLWVGRRSGDTAQTACAMILDDLQIYCSALTDEEISDLYGGKQSFIKKESQIPAGMTAVSKNSFSIPGEVYRQQPLPGLVIMQTEKNTVELSWPVREGVDRYIVLRSFTSGWKGLTALAQEIKRGDYAVHLVSTNGLFPGDELHFQNHREDYYIDQVVDEQQLLLTSPVQRNYAKQSTSINLAAAWIKDYSGYLLMASIPVGMPCRYRNQGLEPETDYFYLIACYKKDVVSALYGPVNIKLTENGILYDAALGLNGGYAWKASQRAGDTPDLIDGDPATSAVRIQVSNPLIPNARIIGLGFTRLNLNEYMKVKSIEISQALGADRIQADAIKVVFDDRSQAMFKLTGDNVTARDYKNGSRNYRLYTLSLDKSTSYLDLCIESVSGGSGRYIEWNKVGVYTNAMVMRPVVSATQAAATVNMEIDFSRTDGHLPVLFGTDEVYNNTEGHETGWMIRTWPYTKQIFNLYRLQMGDNWPRSYGFDLLNLGTLARDSTSSGLEFILNNPAPVTAQLTGGFRLKIGNELMLLSRTAGNKLVVSQRGIETTLKVIHKAGTPVYAYKQAGQIQRLREVLPEFKMIKYAFAYVSGITPVNRLADVNDPARTARLEITVRAGEYKTGDVIRIGAEMFKLLTVKGNKLTALRGFDGTNQRFIQHNYPVTDVYKVIDYEPYYSGFKNDPTQAGNYYWENLKTSFDKVMVEGAAIPWLIVYSPIYATQSRGMVNILKTMENSANVKNNVIVDSYNSKNDDGDWWYRIAPDKSRDNDLDSAGNMYQYHHAELHILTGQAAGKIYYIRSHTEDELRVVRTWNDSLWTNRNPAYVDLQKEGVQKGDVYIVTQGANDIMGNVTPRYWQYNADLFFMIARYIKEHYHKELAARPFYMEYYLEPNLQTYGTWTKDAYIDSYNVFAETIRTGGPHFNTGFKAGEVLIGAGAIAGGLNPENKIAGAVGDYDFALSIIDRANFLDFISHHRYYMGSRSQKREIAWEYSMIRQYARVKGKEIVIIDSEDSVATAGGTGNEQARHWAKFSVPYWSSNFIQSYAGNLGSDGRLAFIIHFRLYHAQETSLGMAVPGPGDEPLLDLVYWPIKLYRDYTSQNSARPDILAYAVKSWDTYGWLQVMGTTHGETGKRYVHLVNKKDTPLTVNLKISGVKAVNPLFLLSISGGGARQSLADGYHPPNLESPVRKQIVADLTALTLEPFSTNILILDK